MAKKKEHSQAGFESIEEALSRTERYIEDNQKSLTIIIVAIFILFGGYFGYRKFIMQPKEKEAESQMFRAENYFAKDSFNLAVNGDGNNLGFSDIIDEYGITPSANLAHYYKGISELQTGNYEDAITDLKKFDRSDKIVAAISLGAIGDAYVQQGDLDKAAEFYNKAIKYSENAFSAPIYLQKLGELYEQDNQLKKALNTYKKIKTEYPNSAEGRSADKYIAQVETKMND